MQLLLMQIVVECYVYNIRFYCYFIINTILIISLFFFLGKIAIQLLLLIRGETKVMNVWLTQFLHSSLYMPSPNPLLRLYHSNLSKENRWRLIVS